LIMARIFLIFTFLIFVFPQAAHATEVFRCGAEIVKIGDSTDTVRKLCGKPARTESGSKNNSRKTKKSMTKSDVGSDTESVKGRKWYYDRGYGDYIYILTFKGNTLAKIQTSERGGK